MKVYYTHGRNIDLITRTAEQRLALVPAPRRRLRLPGFLRLKEAPEQTADGLKFVDGEARPLSSSIFRDSPRRLMRVFLHVQQRGLKLHPDLAQFAPPEPAAGGQRLFAGRACAGNFFGNPGPARQRRTPRCG